MEDHLCSLPGGLERQVRIGTVAESRRHPQVIAHQDSEREFLDSEDELGGAGNRPAVLAVAEALLRIDPRQLAPAVEDPDLVLDVLAVFPPGTHQRGNPVFVAERRDFRDAGSHLLLFEIRMVPRQEHFGKQQPSGAIVRRDLERATDVDQVVRHGLVRRHLHKGRFLGSLPRCGVGIGGRILSGQAAVCRRPRHPGKTRESPGRARQKRPAFHSAHRLLLGRIMVLGELTLAESLSTVAERREPDSAGALA